MASTVWFWNLRASLKAPYEVRMRRILKKAKLGEVIESGDFTAVKLHFGEAGVTGFISPLLIKPIIDFLNKNGAQPFLTDTSTLYVGQRGNAVDHTMLAHKHGFDPLILGAPIIMADGVRGTHETTLPVDGKFFKKTYIAGDIVNADAMVTLSHVKGHPLAGFGGALKNLAMGCATRRGKMQQHKSSGPLVHQDSCVGCGICVEVCAFNALSLDENKKIVVNNDLCAGCGACFHHCKQGALAVDWNINNDEFLQRMMEYASSVVLNRKKPMLFLNFITAVTPECDCVGFSDAPMCPDIGILASYDPVAIDQASIDLVNDAPPLFPSKLPEGTKPGDNKFVAVNPHVAETLGMDYAEALGAGSREYELVMIK